MSLEKKPSVYDYLDYRAYLRDLVDYLRARGEYSVRKFANSAKLKSSNYLYMVLTGQRNITEVTAKRIGRAFDLQVNELSYFVNLVSFTQAADSKAQAMDLKELLRLQRKIPRKQLEAKEIEALSKWQVAVLLIALTTNFRELSVEEQAKTLSVNTYELENWKNILQKSGLLTEDGIPREQSFKIPDQARMLVYRGLHKQMLEKAIEAADDIPVEERDLSFLTLSLGPENFEKARRLVSKFRDEMSDLFSNDSSAESIYQFNFQIFPILKWTTSKKATIKTRGESINDA